MDGNFENYQHFNPGTSLLGGLAQGLAQGKLSKQQMIMQEDELKIRKDALKAEQRYKETMLDMEARGLTLKEEEAQRGQTLQKSLIDMIMGGQGGQQQQVPLPEYQPGQGMPPFAPGATMPAPGGGGGALGITPEDLIRGLIKKEFGAQPTKYSRMATVAGPEGRPVVAPMSEMGDIDITKGMAAPVKPEMQKFVLPGGGEVEVPVDPYTRIPIGNAVPTKLGAMNQPMSAADVLLYADEAGKHPKAGVTPNQAKSQGFKVTDKAMTAETGGKLAMLLQGVKDVEEAEELLFPEGEYDMVAAVAASWGVPGGKYQEISSRIRNAINGKLRAETGAQANPEEIKDMMKRFAPTWKDDGKSAKDKLRRLREFLLYASVTADPSGKFQVNYPKRGPSLRLGNDKKSGPKLKEKPARFEILGVQ